VKVEKAFAPDDMKAFEQEAKCALVATVNPEGLPHVTLISSLRARRPDQLMWGQFTEGLSKKHVRINPKTGFLVLTLDRRLWRGQAVWTHALGEGPEYEMYNKTPMFRYNAYFGIHTVHYMDLVKTYGRESLPLARVVAASLLTRIAGPAAGRGSEAQALKPWAVGLFNRLNALRFMAYIHEDGFPRIFPMLQGLAAGSGRIVFSPLAYGRELEALEAGQAVAVFAMSLSMEDVLARGTFQGYRRRRGARLGLVDLDWVYNSMPPNPGQIYPAAPLAAVERF
jgi:hypothetical protein